MKTFLFQGDSITDAGRDRAEDSLHMGYGYATMTAGLLSRKYPGLFRFVNRGVSGDRVVDLYARIKVDAVNIKPDYMSILVGVNDVWSDYNLQPNGVSAPKYEKIYNMYIDEILEKLPETRIFIMEPFVAAGAVQDEFGREFRTEVEKRAAAARRTAEEHGLEFVPLQEEFDRLAEQYGPEYPTREGIHPTVQGHALIAEKLTGAVSRMISD